MKKMYLLTLLIILIIAVGFILFSSSSDSINQKFLESYGWRVSPDAIETEFIMIPREFDAVYSDYNKLQIEAGLDLDPYRGKRGIRYTYTVLNYPGRRYGVRANVICVKDMPVAGDIMSVELDGFMQSLIFNATDESHE
ncbi:MAG: DUF4830 domain-containing protein [Firmicutes bacterium]|nr:DUF4830 domain-containing protein [Bacillota bacterium]